MKRMALQHTGNNELIYVETEKVCLTIKGKSTYPSNPGVEYREEISSIKLKCKDLIQVYNIKNQSKNQNSNDILIKTSPLFFEQNQYEIVIEGTEDNSVSFWHSNKLIRDKITPSSKHHNWLSGAINFGNEIGYSDLVIIVNGEEYLTLTIEVFPSKINYMSDYEAIVNDVTEETYNLIFDFLKKTYHGYQQSGNKKSSLSEYFAIISEIYKEFLKATDKIIAQPYHLLQKTHEILPVHKIKQADSKALRWIEKHPGNVSVKSGKIFVDRAMSTRKKVTFDNKENRMVKYMLLETVKKLATLKHKYSQLQRQTDEELISKIDNMCTSIKRRVYNSFLREVDATTEKTGMSLVFSMAPGYRELYKCYLMLQRGLDITGDLFHISIKNLAVLYEYWCFIKLNSILKEKYDLISQDIIKVDRNQLVVSLIKGQNSKVKYRNASNGETFVLSYNPKERGLPTVPQRPDNVLSLEKKSIDQKQPIYEYVFDAKYKIDQSLEGSYYHNYISEIPGPKEEDINTMHRYRDSIVSDQGANNFERTMFGAYVLFPYDDEEKYKAHRFYKSIEKVNIGGLPFLPSATNLVEEMLDELIKASPETAFERTTLPIGIEDKLEKVDWSKRDVLVGTLKTVEQLDICKKHLFYHVPMKQIKNEHLPVHYVAIYQSKKKFGDESGIYMYGEVLRTSIVERRDIKEIPKDSDELYYRFDIKEWKYLNRPIEVKERADVVTYTNLFLLQHSYNLSDLRTESEEEYRLYLELRRMINNETLNEERKDLKFAYKDYILDYDKGNIRFFKEGKFVYKIQAEKFIKKPNYCFKEIVKKLESE